MMTRMKKIIAVLLLVVVLPFALQAKPAADSVDLQSLDKYIREVVKDFRLVGLAIAVVKDDQVVFSKGYGLKDIYKKDKVNPGSLFNIASCSKAFTAACIGILVDEGKLKWDDKVIDFLPEFRLSDPYITSALTIRDILSHRSGLGTFDGDLLWYQTGYDNKEVIRRMRYVPIRRQFRSQFGYQNTMYMTAAEIVETVSKQTWDTFLTERILQPLDMKNTRACSKFLQEGMDIAQPHVEGKRYPPYIQNPNAAGSIYSCTAEMVNWMQMLLNKGKWQQQQILKPETIETLFSPHTILRVSSFMKKNGTHFRTYGLGWNILDYYGEKIIEHSGGMPGYISRVTLVPDKKLGVVILTNNMNPVPALLRYKILDLFLTKNQKRKTDREKIFLEMIEKQEERKKNQKAEREQKRVKGTKPSLALEKYVGLYKDRMYGKAKIGLEMKKLVLTLLPTRDIFTSPMEHWHYNTFRVRFKDEFLPDGFVTFDFDSDGKVTGFTIDLPNPDFHFHHLDFKKIE